MPQVSELTQPKVLARKFIRVRDRNQITLPHEIISGMPIGTGDFLEVVLTDDGSIHLKRTLLITSVNSLEAYAQEAAANKDITEKNYGTFDSADDLMKEVADKRRDKRRAAAVATGVPMAMAAAVTAVSKK